MAVVLNNPSIQKYKNGRQIFIHISFVLKLKGALWEACHVDFSWQKSVSLQS